MNKAELLEKKEMVADISAVLAKHLGHIESVSYEVFYKEGADWSQEYLVYHFRGGAILARNCNWNSKTAVIDEIAKYINGGYYSEVDDYKAYESKAAAGEFLKL